MFKHANPSSRTPVYLQAYTKENVVWQLKLSAVILTGVIVYEYVAEKRAHKRLMKNV